MSTKKEQVQEIIIMAFDSAIFISNLETTVNNILGRIEAIYGNNTNSDYLEVQSIFSEVGQVEFVISSAFVGNHIRDEFDKSKQILLDTMVDSELLVDFINSADYDKYYSNYFAKRNRLYKDVCGVSLSFYNPLVIQL